ncbi:MAG: outer membrane beta-barrel protein [Candidatus Kapaibacterium sp.]
MRSVPINLSRVATLLFALFLSVENGSILYGQDRGTIAHSADTLETDLPLWRVGLLTALQFNRYDVSFSKLPGVPSCCPEYRGGGGIGVAVGGTFELPLDTQWSLGGRISYSNFSGSVQTEESQLVYDGTRSVEATLEHQIDASLSRLTIEPFALFYPIQSLRLFSGSRIGVGLGSHFTQTERILSPGNIRFENDRRFRNEFSGTIPNASSIGIDLLLGLGYELPWKGIDGVTFAPEISGWYGLTKVAEGVDWSIHGVRVGVSVLYSKQRSARDTIRPDDTETILPPVEGSTGPTGAGG